MKMLCDCSGDCSICEYSDCCCAGHGDDDYTLASSEKIMVNLECGWFADRVELMTNTLKDVYGICWETEKEIRKNKIHNLEQSLRPCPWCGETPILDTPSNIEILSLPRYERSYRVVCSNKNCPIQSFHYNTPEEAVRWWNERFEDRMSCEFDKMAHDEKVSRLREILTGMKDKVSEQWYEDTENAINAIEEGDIWSAMRVLAFCLMDIPKENRPI